VPGAYASAKLRVSATGTEAEYVRIARQCGAASVINSAEDKAVEQIMQMTGGNGVDVAVEAVGTPANLVTHRFALADVMNAYDTLGNAAREGALEAILEAEPRR